MKLDKIENLIDQSKPHKYNFEFECGMDDYSNLPPIERWITYIATDADPKEGYFPEETINFASEAKKKYRTLSDCDGSGNKENDKLIHEIYNVLFAWENEGGNFRKVDAFQCDFGGETMNSLFYPLIDHAGVEIKQIPKKPVMDTDSKNHLMDYFVQKETHDRFLDVLQNTPGLIDYIKSYHTIGNFTLVPAYFNAYRGGKFHDYWDESLKYIISFFISYCFGNFSLCTHCVNRHNTSFYLQHFKKFWNRCYFVAFFFTGKLTYYKTVFG